MQMMDGNTNIVTHLTYIHMKGTYSTECMKMKHFLTRFLVVVA